MSNRNLEKDDFKLVSHRKKRIKSTIQKSFPKIVDPSDAGVLLDEDISIRRILSAKKDILEADIYASTLASLREALEYLENTDVVEIVCLGLGKIGECMIARYQLAFLLCLKDLYDAKTYVYDPVFRNYEQSILQRLDCSALLHNSEGKFKIKKQGTTLIYLPHCPKQLSNNFLWANWGLQLNRCIVVANSFTKIIENTPKRFLVDGAGYILNISPYVLELAIINNFKYYDIFNDTAIHIFPWQKLTLISQDFWNTCVEPNYVNTDVEFITKDFHKLSV